MALMGHICMLALARLLCSRGNRLHAGRSRAATLPDACSLCLPEVASIHKDAICAIANALSNEPEILPAHATSADQNFRKPNCLPCEHSLHSPLICQAPLLIESRGDGLQFLLLVTQPTCRQQLTLAAATLLCRRSAAGDADRQLVGSSECRLLVCPFRTPIRR